MYRRNIKPLLERSLKRSPLVLIIGARQVGKTTLTLEIAKEKNYTYITFDDIRFLASAKNDPIGFIAALEKPVILDEIQRLPELFLPIKKDIDENRISGRYILTGSANPLVLPRIGDSLVGRIEIITMMPLSQGELNNKLEKFIDLIFDDKPIKLKNVMSKKDLYQRIIVGGYPPVQNLDDEGKDAWFYTYTTTILQRDVNDLSNITRALEFPNLLKFLCTRIGGLHNTAELSRVMKIPTVTLHRYLAILETLFMINLLQPWSTNLGKRFIKASKLYLVDSGILSYLLGINLERAVSDSQIMGPILENFIVSELRKQITWSQTKPEIYHFRTQTGIEVDIILEDRLRRIVAIEIKNSQNISPQDFKGLKYLEELIPDRFIKGIVLYTGNEIIPFGKNLVAMPISILWDAFE